MTTTKNTVRVTITKTQSALIERLFHACPTGKGIPGVVGFTTGRSHGSFGLLIVEVDSDDELNDALHALTHLGHPLRTIKQIMVRVDRAITAHYDAEYDVMCAG